MAKKSAVWIKIVLSEGDDITGRDWFDGVIRFIACGKEDGQGI